MNLTPSQINFHMVKLSLGGHQNIGELCWQDELKCDNICDTIIVKEVCRKESGEFSSLGLALNIDDHDQGHDRSIDKGESKLRSRQQITCNSYGNISPIKRDQ